MIALKSKVKDMTNAYKELHYMESARNSLSGVKHVHDRSYEILFVIDGDGSMLIGNNIYPIKENTVFLTSKMEIHNITPSSEKYVRNIININDDYIEKIIELTGAEDFLSKLFGRRCIPLSDEDATLIKRYFSLINECDPDDPEHRIMLLRYITGMLKMLSDTKTTESQVINNSISEAIAYIDRNLSEELTLEMICNHVHLSKYHFCRLFREKTGMSPFKYIIECRISNAKKLLTYTSDSISNIAVATGFSTSANFCNAFRKYEKLSPTDFRARNSNQP